jgi:hypothetical protein
MIPLVLAHSLSSGGDAPLLPDPPIAHTICHHGSHPNPMLGFPLLCALIARRFEIARLTVLPGDRGTLGFLHQAAERHFKDSKRLVITMLDQRGQHGKELPFAGCGPAELFGNGVDRVGGIGHGTLA